MAEPRRIQRKRTKGYRLPEGAIYVGRPTKYGNPFKVGDVNPEDGDPMSAEDAVGRYIDHFHRHPELKAAARRELAGHDLACWCRPGSPCHADILLRVANG